MSSDTGWAISMSNSSATLTRFRHVLVDARDNDVKGTIWDDLLALIMAAQLAEENQISPRLVRDEIMTLLLAGFETSATTMTWAICLLERHPEAWSRMVTEVDLALGGRTPQFRDLAALPYTRAVLRRLSACVQPCGQFRGWRRERMRLEASECPAVTSLFWFPT